MKAKRLGARGIGRFFGRLVLATMVSFVSSWVTLFPAIEFFGVSLFIPPALVGFVGVLSGSICFESGTRSAGALLLLFLGLGYYRWFWISSTRYEDPTLSGEFPHFTPLAVGGLIAVLLVLSLSWIKQRRNASITEATTPH